MPIDEDLVANPRYLELQHALIAVRQHAQALESALDNACGMFGGRQVWVGPAARTFGEELNGRRSRLQRAVQNAIAELEAELRGIPAKVSPAVAARESG